MNLLFRNKQSVAAIFRTQARQFCAAEDPPKITPLYNFHKDDQKAKMVPFAGYSMPVQYPSGIIKEHNYTREKATIFDVSHMGPIRIYGEKRNKFLESLTVVDLQNLKPNHASLSLITNENGGVIDDTVITNMGDYIYMVVNAGCKDKDLKHIINHLEKNFKRKDVRIDYTEEDALIALQGPKAAEILQKFVDFNLADVEFMQAHMMKIKPLGVECLVSRSGYTGEDGFEINIRNDKAEPLCRLLLEQKDEKGEQIVNMAGLGARDSLRLEAGLCLYGHELNEEITPIEAQLAWTISKRRREEGGFPGYEVISKQLKEGPSKKRIGFVVNGAPAREGAPIFVDDKQVGQVTSGTFSPILKKGIGMAYIDTPYLKNPKLQVSVRDKKQDLTIKKLPFVKANYYKKEGDKKEASPKKDATKKEATEK